MRRANVLGILDEETFRLIDETPGWDWGIFTDETLASLDDAA